MDDEKTIGELVDELGLGGWFRDNYLLPMCGAIWSTPMEEVDRFPARSLVQFFRNHALLAGSGQHQWWTVKGGSIEYVNRLQAALVARGCDIRLDAPVARITRGSAGVRVMAPGAGETLFDDVVLACHSDQALAILGGDASEEEAGALGDIRYQDNHAVLHCDPGQMPRRRACWSSWVYRSQGGAIGVTYWMNRLQGIPESDPLFVTLNPSREIPAESIYDEVTFAHPVFDKAALRAQQRIREMQGRNRTWFAGAYNRHGFHEDGIKSAVDVAEGMLAKFKGGNLPAAPFNAFQRATPWVPRACDPHLTLTSRVCVPLFARVANAWVPPGRVFKMLLPNGDELVMRGPSASDSNLAAQLGGEIRGALPLGKDGKPVPETITVRVYEQRLF